MFKSLSLLIHKTPWWGLLLGGGITLLTLLLFATPIQVIRLSEQAGSPEQKRAIQHEINQAFKSGGLSLAEGIVSAMKERAKDPDRRRELERALREIERARTEVASVENEAARVARDAAQEALDAAHESAQATLEAAQEARQAVEEARNETLESLRSKGLDVGATERSFDELLRGAKEKEAAAQATLDGIAKSREVLNQQSAAARSGTSIQIKVPGAPQGQPTVQVEVNPPPAAPPAPPTGAVAAAPPVPPLAPELRNRIRASVAGDMWRAGVGSALILAFIPLFVALLIAKFFIDRSHRALAFAEEKKEEALVSDMRRQMTEARLQALQAQVEPHFLYNTLANVQALTEVDPMAANQLVGHLIQYLRASLPKMRESSSTVGQELERVRAYLNILKMRMGERLAFDIHADDGLLGLPLPPMMLPSLVENAIKHGLEPRREGGRIDVAVTRVLRNAQARLVLQVTDTGAGLSEQTAETGGGVGLSNLRERLAALYGGSGSFTLEANQPVGVVATIDIPADLPPPSGVPAAGEGVATADAAPQPATGWRRLWRATRKTHSVWASAMSRVFMVLMAVLLLGLMAGLIGLFTGWLPVQINEFRLDGLEGMALGSVGLLVAFGAAALVVTLLVVLMYGLGFLFAGLLILILVAILISLFPALSPFILIGLVIYAVWRKKRKNRVIPDSYPKIES